MPGSIFKIRANNKSRLMVKGFGYFTDFGILISAGNMPLSNDLLSVIKCIYGFG
jgi:hypothetical protein